MRFAAFPLLFLFAQTAQAEELQIPFTKEKLANGLTVILHEDHAVPQVVVDVSYRVGSRFEQPKRTGFAHLFEHLMFMGTRRVPTKAFDAWMEGVGGFNNAWTSEDRTGYFSVGPSPSLPLLLWLEADRLRDVGPLMTREKLDAQRDVVRNERRQTSENQPYGKAELRLPELLYPSEHPYHHPVIGSHEDLEAATVPDVQSFFSKYYDPANASLVVAGDFDRDKIRPYLRQWFETIPSRGRPSEPEAFKAPQLPGVVRETLTDHVELSKIIFAWHSPKHFAPGDAELDLLASILSSGKASRLYRSLVYKDKLLQRVNAYQSSGTLGSQFRVEVLVRPGIPLSRVEAGVEKELSDVVQSLVEEEELTRAKNGLETAFVGRLQGVRERAALLNAYEAEVSDPGYIEKDRARYRAVTRESLRNVASSVLTMNARVVLTVNPAGEKGGAK